MATLWNGGITSVGLGIRSGVGMGTRVGVGVGVIVGVSLGVATGLMHPATKINPMHMRRKEVIAFMQYHHRSTGKPHQKKPMDAYVEAISLSLV